MSTNKPPTRNEPLLQQSMETQGMRKAGNPAPGSLLPGGAVIVPGRRPAQASQEHHILKVFLTLLVILCIYCLGSFPLISYTIAPLLSSTPSSTLPSSTSSPAKSLVLPSPTQAPAEGGKCNVAPTDLHYLPPPSGTAQNGPLPQIWSQAGYNEQDFASASACAASFLIAYQSFDSSQAQTFVACTSMLSTGAQQRFFGQTASRPADIHADQFWRASIQKQQIRQSAQTSAPVLLKAQFDQQRMFAWMLVPYQLTLHRYDEEFTYNNSMTVLVISFPRNNPQQGSVWQVSDWQNGSVIFDPERPL